MARNGGEARRLLTSCSSAQADPNGRPRFEVVVNLKAAEALDLAVPSTITIRAADIVK
jgi:hypothetical protein